MRTLLAAALLLLSGAAHAQIITINENLDTSTSTFYFDTNSPRLNVATDTYTGGVPGAVLFVGSNAVVGTGTGAKSEVVIYATGTIDILGHAVSFTGISSGCAAGFYLSTMTLVNGVVTGGGCVAAGGNTVGVSSGPMPAGTYLATATWVNGVLTGGGFVAVTDFGPSTATLAILITGLEASTTTLSASTVTLAGLITGLEASTTTLSASTASIYIALNSTASYMTTQFTSVASATTTLQTNINGKQNSFVGISSSCAAGQYLSTATITNGVITGGGCVVAGTGSGGSTTTVVSTMTITWQNDNFISLVSGTQKTFTLSLTPSSTAAVTCVLDGLILGASDYTFTMPTSVALTTAPAANSTGFFCQYTVNTSTFPAVFILNSSQTVSGATTFAGAVTFSSSVVYSTYTYTIQNLNGLTFGGINGRARAFTNCMATITWVADGISTYTVILDLVGQNGAGSNTFGFWAILDGGFTGVIPAQTSSTPQKACFLTSLEQRQCNFTATVSPSPGSHNMCLGYGQTNYGDTVTVGGGVFPCDSTFSLKVAR